MVEEQNIIKRHLLVEVFKKFHTRETKVNQVYMSDAIVTLADIADRVPNTYNTDKGWVVKIYDIRVC
jgi:hypothetical protein